MKARTALALALMSTSSFLSIAWSSTPPEVVNYQGVLRDASGQPEDGSFDMVFRFFDAPTSGDEILVDAHTSAGGLAVAVSGGMFSVRLGTGVLSDGAGPGSYTDLAGVFRAHRDVHLQVEINGEVLAPRVPVASAPYALNSSNLGGLPSNEYLNTNGSEQTKSGRLVVDASAETTGYGIRAYGPTAGALFQDSDTSSYALLGYGTRGLEAHGTSIGAYFQNDTDLSHAFAGQGGHGLKGFGPQGGGYFGDTNASGWAAVAYEDYGIWSAGNGAGAFFQDLDDVGYAYVGSGDRGIEAYGSTGGFFQSSTGGATAYVAGGTWGISAFGGSGGGSFSETDSSAEAKLAFADVGVDASGGWAGAILRDTDGSGLAWLAYGHEGVRGAGNTVGGYFYDRNGSGEAYTGYGDYGVQGYGSAAGGFFSEDDTSAYAFAAYLGWGINAAGPSGGGEFNDTNASGFARVGYSTYKIQGSGAVSFVQNHPANRDQVIVYHSPEGDEVATYTRGSGRLVDGEARIPLGETFAWVTNPDIGLTAHLTPHGAAVPLAVVSLTTDELVVRGPADGPADVAFDYMVHGLRIGFESVSVVQEKQREARIPSMDEHRERYERNPGLRQYNALERFKTMTAGVRGVEKAQLDLGGAAALRAAIQEYDREVHGPVGGAQTAEGRASGRGLSRTVEANPAPPVDAPASEERTVAPDVSQVRETPGRQEAEREEPVMVVTGAVEVGDVLSFHRESPGSLTLSGSPYDSAVVGIATDASRPTPDGAALAAPVAFTGVVPCKVDASYGAVRPGDLLTTSPTPGHAMIAIDPAPGTVVGKAIESVDSGTATIRVLVMAR